MTKRLAAFGRTRALAFAALSIAVGTAPASAQTKIFVDADAPAGGTGQILAWGDPLQDLQAAIDVATAMGLSSDVHILVAEGTYRPKPTGVNPGSLRTFEVTPAVEKLHIHGGYLGFGVPGASQNENAPDGSMVRTVLSGRQYADPVSGLIVPPAYHVVRLLGGGHNAQVVFLDGFTIRDGMADDPGIDENTRGAGVHVQRSGQVTLENLVFFNNVAKPLPGFPRTGVGAGVFSSVGGNPGEHVWIRFCTFRQNYAARGSALYYDTGPDLRVGNSKFMLNGNLKLDWPSADTAVPISDLGGAIYLGTQTHFKASNSTFFDNVAALGGGALCWEPIRNLNVPALPVIHEIWHSTFTLNRVTQAPVGTGRGSAIHALPGDTNYGATPIKEMKLYNSIIWGNTGGPDIVVVGDFIPNAIDGVRIEVHDSDLGTSASFNIAPTLGMPWAPGVYTFGSTISLQPQFVSVVQRNLRLAPSSPCVDTASLSWLGSGTDIVDVNGVNGTTDPLDLDLDLTARIKGALQTPDMGAFEL